MRDLSVLRRITAVTAACLLLAGASGLPHEHAADHDGERAHVEIPHGGHGVVVELTTPQIRSHAPPPIPFIEAASPDWRPGPPLTESDDTPRRLPDPQSHPPPPPRRARAPPLS